MAISDFFDHKCTIFHLMKSQTDRGYGIVDSNIYKYPEKPNGRDIDIPCHFHVKTGLDSIVQTDPLNLYHARVKISLPVSTDIRLNDKIISEDGYEYIAELPRKIRNHHIIVYANRQTSVKEAL